MVTDVPATPYSAGSPRWTTWSVHALWFLGGLVLVVGLLVDVGYAAGSGRQAFVQASCVGVIAAFALSSRYPTAGLIAVCTLGVVLAVVISDVVPDAVLTTWAALVLTSGVVALRSPVAHLPVLAGVVVATALVTGHLLLDEMMVSGIIGLTPFMTLSVGAGAWLRFQRHQRRRAVLDARNAERVEIAREMHDVVAHHVTAIVVRAQAGQFSTDPTAPRAALAAIESEGAAAMAAMRRMVASLRTSDIATLSTDVTAELENLATALRDAGLSVDETVGEVPASLAPTIVRLTREAYTNVHKHAVGATEVRLTVQSGADRVHWSVIDDGRPAVKANGHGFGLVGLRERVVALGGEFSAGPHADGWEIRADLPRGGGA